MLIRTRDMGNYYLGVVTGGHLEFLGMLKGEKFCAFLEVDVGTP